MVGYDHVDQAVGQRIDEFEPLALAAQRRAQFQESAVVADVDFVEREIVDGDAASDGKAIVARAGDRRQRKPVRDEGAVVACAGQRDEPEIAIEHDRLGLAGNSGQPEPARALALRHHTLAGEVTILAIVHDQRAEIARVGQGAAHGLRVGDGVRAVGEGDRAGLGEHADLRDLRAPQALGHRRRR